MHFQGTDAVTRIRTVYETPVGTVSRVDRPAPGTSWHEQYLFQRPEDYRPIEFLIRNQHYEPAYDCFLTAQRRFGDDVFLRASIGGYSPLQEILIRIMGLECFSIEWAERRDEVLKLYAALTEQRRKVYPLVAQSPALAVNYGGNINPAVMGLPRFEQYVLPHYDECAAVLHQRGKLVGVHLDANNRLLAPSIARSRIDYVEAFTPPPTCDMSVVEARRCWPNKVLWINFPSSVHVAAPAVVAATTRQLLQEAAPGDGFLLGITEDVPPDRWQQSFLAISQVITTTGRYPVVR